MRKTWLLLLLATSILQWACQSYNDYAGVPFEEKQPADWENPAVNEINREAPRAWFVPFATPEEVDADNIWASSFMQSLNGEWQFMYSDSFGTSLLFFKDDFTPANGLHHRPLNFELEGFTYPIYTNVQYPHAVTRLPFRTINPVGSTNGSLVFLKTGTAKKFTCTLGQSAQPCTYGSMSNKWATVRTAKHLPFSTSRLT